MFPHKGAVISWLFAAPGASKRLAPCPLLHRVRPHRAPVAVEEGLGWYLNHKRAIDGPWGRLGGQGRSWAAQDWYRWCRLSQSVSSKAVTLNFSSISSFCSHHPSFLLLLLLSLSLLPLFVHPTHSLQTAQQRAASPRSLLRIKSSFPCTFSLQTSPCQSAYLLPTCLSELTGTLRTPTGGVWGLGCSPSDPVVY